MLEWTQKINATNRGEEELTEEVGDELGETLGCVEIVGETLGRGVG